MSVNNANDTMTYVGGGGTTREAQGVVVLAGGGAISIADGADAAEGATNAPAYTDASGAAPSTVVGGIKGLVVALYALIGKLPASLGAKAGAASLSVTPASDAAFVVQDDGVSDAATRINSVSSAAVGASFSTAGYGSITFQIVANAGSNQVTLEGSNDGGTTWSVVAFRTAGSTAGSGASVVAASAVGTAFVPAAILPLMRWRISTFVSGTTTIAVGMKRWSFPNVVDAYVGGGTITAIPLIGNSPDKANVGAILYNDTSSPLGSGATFIGVTRDLTVTITGSLMMFGASFAADQAGTAYIDYSTDGTSWSVAGTVAVTAAATVTSTTVPTGPVFDINVRIRARYYRVRFINGATAQGAFRAVSSFTAG